MWIRTVRRPQCGIKAALFGTCLDVRYKLLLLCLVEPAGGSPVRIIPVTKPVLADPREPFAYGRIVPAHTSSHVAAHKQEVLVPPDHKISQDVVLIFSFYVMTAVRFSYLWLMVPIRSQNYPVHAPDDRHGASDYLGMLGKIKSIPDQPCRIAVRVDRRTPCMQRPPQDRRIRAAFGRMKATEAIRKGDPRRMDGTPMTGRNHFHILHYLSQSKSRFRRVRSCSLCSL